ncbi:MAG: hydroxyethylthiazole kinase [Roseburia sp.]|nr:hydroxyethylthiazole kinase [Roseburia sp.]
MRECLENVRKRNPLIHNITNYVTVNDVANALLACGGSPIMAEAAEEVEEITAGCDGLNLNIGMLNPAKACAMELAGLRAQKEGHVILLDPVGVGASAFRRETVKRLLEKIKFTAIRGNISEIRAVAELVGVLHSDVKYNGAVETGGFDCSNEAIAEKIEGKANSSRKKRKAADNTIAENTGTKAPESVVERDRAKSHGVDAAQGEAVTEENAETVAEFVKELAGRTGSIIAVTGRIDLVADEKNCYRIQNGRPEMSRITGTGCQLSGMMTAFLAANPDCPLKAAAAAVCCMGLAGEKAWEYMAAGEGNASYRNRIIDAISLMEGEALEKGARYEIC